LEGVSLGPDVPITINTLSDVLYMEQYNDISFTVDNKLVVLIEHQSTINPNMPLRLLLYIARVYEKIIERKNLYRERLLKIPRPEFIVLYNGLKPYPERSILKLSGAYEERADLKKGPVFPPELDLTVKVYNINRGYNEEIIRKSEKLKGYSFFVDKIRENRRTMPLEKAMKATIEYCIAHDILTAFLQTNSSEVINMLLSEWNIDEAKEVWREEGLEMGREEGQKIGREEGREMGLEMGREEGREIGLEMGRENMAVEVARNALHEGLSPEIIRKLTGLDIDTIKNLSL
jgi:predicted transposase YdaD